MAEVDAAVKMQIILDGENDSDPSIEERMRFNEEIFSTHWILEGRLSISLEELE